MARRITVSELRSVVARINRLANAPAEPYTDSVANVGCYHLSQAYGGYALHRVHNVYGGVVDALRTGHIPARALLGAMYAFIAGVQAGQAGLEAGLEAGEALASK